MPQWFTELSTLDEVFTCFALIGGFLFSVRLVLMFIGMGAESVDGGLDIDTGSVDVHGVDVGHDAGAAHGHDSDASFKLLSFQGLTAFFMMFGLVGLALSLGSHLGAGTALVGGLAAGVGSVWVIDKLFVMFIKLQHSGTLDMRNAIGQEGTVYLTIPEGETGKVQVTVQGALKVLDAVSAGAERIPTDARVKVVDLTSAGVLVVKRV